MSNNIFSRKRFSLLFKQHFIHNAQLLVFSTVAYIGVIFIVLSIVQVGENFRHVPACVLYVCCGSKCKKRGGKHLYKQLKSSVKERSLKRTLQVIKTGCTDRCKSGPIVAVMPQNTWYTQMDEEKAASLFEQASATLQDQAGSSRK